MEENNIEENNIEENSTISDIPNVVDKSEENNMEEIKRNEELVPKANVPVVEDKVEVNKEENQVKEGKATKSMRSNPWIVSTFVLGTICLIFVVMEFIPEGVGIPEVNINQNICSQIRVTPSWVNEKGQIQEGYLNLTTSDVSKVIDKFIEERVYFVYKKDCGWCERQVMEFGDSWSKYYNSGLTIEC